MKIRTRVLLAFVLFVSLGIFGLVYWIADEIRPQYLKAQEEALVDLAELMATQVSEQSVRVDDQGQLTLDTTQLETLFRTLPQRDLNARIYSLDKTRVDLRIYLTDAAGRVIFDSDGQRDLGADYSRWRDVRLTLEGRYGARATSGDPIFPEGSTLYIARPVLYQGDVVGVLSVGKPTLNANRFIVDIRSDLLLTACAIALAVTLVGLLLNLWLTRPLLNLQQYATAVGRGERSALPRLGRNEVGDVGDALESMREALDGKSYVADYVQSLTHEIKAPIAGIRGAAELLQEPIAPEHQQKFLRNIVDQTERIQDLIERLLDLAALEYRPALENRETVDLDALVNDVIADATDFARRRSVALETALDRPGLTLDGDPFLLKQALTNLVKNAIEHSPAGETVTVAVQQNADGCELSVSDRGAGIPDYAIDRVVDRFYSLPKPDGSKGSGLGLSFVKEIMALHQGTVVLESRPGGGTRAVLRV